VLVEILRGGAEKAREAGIAIVGGHTIQSEEPIYGLAVTGLVDTEHVVTNARGRAGDTLILTKPIGVGIITTAAKQRKDSREAIAEAIRCMTTLNRSARDAMLEIGPTAATDVTGFGLLGHLRNVALASGCSALIRAGGVPLLAAAREYAEDGIVPGGTHANARFLAEHVQWAPAVDRATQLLLCDAQTSGGLLIAVAPERADALLRALETRGTLAAAVVGALDSAPPGKIRVDC
jgi:selenide,water dikinase